MNEIHRSDVSDNNNSGTFDPDKRTISNEVNDSKETSNEKFNPDKRIDYSKSYEIKTTVPENFNLDKRISSLSFEERMQVVDAREEEPEKLGGSYKDVYRSGDGENTEVHHMPADSTSELSRGDGPAIKMDKTDHRMTASCGNSIEAREYRAEQKRLINEGKFREALQMDIDDIHDKFGDKYDEAISQMMDYVDDLEKEGKI